MQRTSTLEQTEINTDQSLAINGEQTPQTDNEPTDIFDQEAIVESMDNLCIVFKDITLASLPMIGTATLPIQFFIFSLVLIHLSEDENTLASTGLIFQMILFLLIQLSPVFGSSVIIRNQRGELKKAEEEHPEQDHSELYQRISAMPKSMMITTSITSPASFFPLYFSDNVLVGLFRQDSVLAALDEPFLRIYSYSVPGQSFRMPLQHLLYGFEKAIPAALMSLASLGATTLLGLSLSYGWFGSAPLGRIGMAIGASIEPYLTAGMYMLYVRLNKDFSRFHFLSSNNHRFILTQLKAIARIGIPITASLITDMGSSMALGALTDVTGGREALAATAILNQLNSFMTIVRPPLTNTVSLKLSYVIGHQEFDKASNYAKKGLIATTIITTPVPLVTAVAPDLLVLISGKKFESMSFMRSLAPILGWTQIMEGLRMGLMNQLHAFNDNNIPAIITVGGTALGITIGAVTGIYTNGKIFALTGAYAGGLTLSVSILGFRWYNSSKAANIEKRQQEQLAVYRSSPSFTLFKCCQRKNKELTPLLQESDIEQTTPKPV